MTLRTNRTHRERGVIAIIAGVSLFFVVALGISIAELGLNAVHTFEAHNAAEALALSQGMVVLSSPSPWSGAQVPIDMVVPGNSRSVETSEGFQFVPVPNKPNGPSTPDAAPGIIASKVSGPLQNFGNMLQQPLTVGGGAASAVYQFQTNQLVPVLSRIVLVLDYSKSMRLYYNGYAQDTGAALTALRTAANLVIMDPNLSQRVNWGLVEFAGQVDPNPVPPIKLPQTAPYQTLSPGQISQQQSTLQDHLHYGTGSGMTDMADAVDQARAMLDDMGTPGPNNPDLGKGIILLISDGEPDYDPANLDDSAATYQARVQAAEDNVHTAIVKAWNSGYQTMTITVWTKPASVQVPPESLTGFMQSITGNSDGKKQVEPQNAFVAAAPTDIPNWLATINPVTHCISKSPMDLSGSQWMNLPGANDNIYGYYVAGGQPSYLESVVTRSRDPNNMDPVWVNNKWTNQTPQFWWDPTNKIVELNVTACLSYLAQQNMNPPPAFRMRWGVPRLYASQKLKTGG